MNLQEAVSIVSDYFDKSVMYPKETEAFSVLLDNVRLDAAMQKTSHSL